ncbi:guanine deaminase-like [Penaeus japonicus]|uniref:guanine deaminase-like n=1 Tax=Penaeus japonicus TaxID=27405 RepID=UPI001C715541|nr:guanine deaminase-like [Penaeus japonicus]
MVFQDRLLRCGTTIAFYFGSSHLEGTKILGDTVLYRGQRALMEGLAQLAAKHDCHIQSHIFESQSETDWVQELFPWSTSYANAYNTVGLLTDKLRLNRAIDGARRVAEERGGGTAEGARHGRGSLLPTPTSLYDTDFVTSGGFFVRASRLTSAQTLSTKSYESITLKEAFRLASLGGAKDEFTQRYFHLSN